MPLFNFATYADYREEWAIEAENPDHARELIGTDPDGAWQDRARLLDADLWCANIIGNGLTL